MQKACMYCMLVYQAKTSLLRVLCIGPLTTFYGIAFQPPLYDTIWGRKLDGHQIAASVGISTVSVKNDLTRMLGYDESLCTMLDQKDC